MDFQRSIRSLSNSCTCLQVVTLHTVIFICFLVFMIYNINVTLKDVYRQFSIWMIMALMVVLGGFSIFQYSICTSESNTDTSTIILATQLSIIGTLFSMWLIVRWNVTSDYLVPLVVTGYDASKSVAGIGYDVTQKVAEAGYGTTVNVAGATYEGVKKTDEELRR